MAARKVLRSQPIEREGLVDVKPLKKEIILYDGAGKPAARSHTGNSWIDEGESRKWRVLLPTEEVFPVEGAIDVRKKAQDIQRQMLRKQALEVIELHSIFDSKLAIVAYNEKHKMGYPKDDVEYCERYGFDPHLRPIVDDMVGAGEARMLGLMSDVGFRDQRSFGRFISIATPKAKLKAIGDSTTLYFGCLAKPLIDELKASPDPDEKMKNFKIIMDSLNPEVRHCLFPRLGEHPNALKTMLQIGWSEGDRISQFLKRIIQNPKAYDGVLD
jgi:hypothetical protein